MPTFDSRDPSAPSFWSQRFEQNYMPWDYGGVPEALKRFVVQTTQKYVTLIPGCGVGYEVAYLSEAGWDVTAIDFSPAAVSAAQAVLGPWVSRVVEADFFTFAPPRRPDLIYERAFLCALPRERWPQIAMRWAKLLPPGGLLAGFFYFDGTVKGPPFGISPSRLDDLLTPHFERIEDLPASDSVAVFAGRERWQIWRRLPTPAE
jgi:SAM-dependent methyltransferase